MMKNHYANSARILLDNITLFLNFNLKHVCVNILIYTQKKVKKYKYLQEETIERKNCRQILPLC